jgi:hypothetical protein
MGVNKINDVSLFPSESFKKEYKYLSWLSVPVANFDTYLLEKDFLSPDWTCVYWIFQEIKTNLKWGNINWAWELLKLGPPNLLFGLLKKLIGLLT